MSPEGPLEVPNTKRVGNVDVQLSKDGFIESIKLAGKVLFLKKDTSEIKAQLSPRATDDQQATNFPEDNELVSNVSTDAIIRARPDCYYYDEKLGGFLLRTLKVNGENPISPDSIKSGEFAAIAAGSNWGCGSSREHAALALLFAGIGVVYAPSIAPIHYNNLINSGMFPVTARSTMEKLVAGETVTFEELSAGLGEFQQRIMKRGGLFPFMQAWSEGKEEMDEIDTPMRPMTMVEKMMAAKMNTKNGAVKPGDSSMLEVDVTLCHDYTTAQVGAMIEAGLGRKAQVKNPDRHHSFPDHLTLIEQGLAGAVAEEIRAVIELRQGQAQVAREAGINFHQRAGETGSDGICHQIFREQVVKPGQIVVGTDSHTCSAGALNSYAFGVGSSNIATAWEHDVIQATVPEAIKVVFKGKMPQGCSGKDVMLLLAHIAQQRAQKKDGVLITGRVLEFTGEGLESMTADDQWVLGNMATECSAEAGIVAPNKILEDYLVAKRGMITEEVRNSFVAPDDTAEYADTIEIDLSTLDLYVATPGHTGNSVPLEQVAGTSIDKAYNGSCTAGSIGVLRDIAAIVQGKRVVVETHVQPGSIEVLREAVSTGVIQTLEDAGITVIKEPGCGACLAAGPGGPKEGKTVISGTNRNFSGRMGDGDAYLANPKVVAVAALLGHIPSMYEFRKHTGIVS